MSAFLYTTYLALAASVVINLAVSKLDHSGREWNWGTASTGGVDGCSRFCSSASMRSLESSSFCLPEIKPTTHDS